MTKYVQEVQLMSLAHNVPGSVSVPAGAEFLTAQLDAFDQPVIKVVADFDSVTYEPRMLLLVGSYQPLPDADLRWVGSFSRPGWSMETHVFEVLS